MFDFGEIASKEIITVTFTLFAVIDMLGSIPILVSLKEKFGNYLLGSYFSKIEHG